MSSTRITATICPTASITLLTDGKSRNSEPIWSNRGDRIAYTSTRRNGADTDIYVESPTDPKTDRLLTELKGGGWEPADWSPDDKHLVVVEGISINESYLWLFDTQTGEKKAVTPRPPDGAEKVSYSSALFSKDGKGLFVTTDRESEFQRLAYVDLASGKHTLPPAGREMGCEQLGLEPRRQTNRLCPERKWREHTAPDRARGGKWHGHGTAAERSGLQSAPAGRRHFWPALASRPKAKPGRFQCRRGAFAFGCLCLGRA